MAAAPTGRRTSAVPAVRRAPYTYLGEAADRAQTTAAGTSSGSSGVNGVTPSTAIPVQASTPDIPSGTGQPGPGGTTLFGQPIGDLLGTIRDIADTTNSVRNALGRGNRGRAPILRSPGAVPAPPAADPPPDASGGSPLAPPEWMPRGKLIAAIVAALVLAVIGYVVAKGMGAVIGFLLGALAGWFGAGFFGL